MYGRTDEDKPNDESESPRSSSLSRAAKVLLQDLGTEIRQRREPRQETTSRDGTNRTRCQIPHQSDGRRRSKAKVGTTGHRQAVWRSCTRCRMATRSTETHCCCSGCCGQAATETSDDGYGDGTSELDRGQVAQGARDGGAGGQAEEDCIRLDRDRKSVV